MIKLFVIVAMCVISSCASLPKTVRVGPALTTQNLKSINGTYRMSRKDQNMIFRQLFVNQINFSKTKSAGDYIKLQILSVADEQCSLEIKCYQDYKLIETFSSSGKLVDGSLIIDDIYYRFPILIPIVWSSLNQIIKFQKLNDCLELTVAQQGVAFLLVIPVSAPPVASVNISLSKG